MRFTSGRGLRRAAALGPGLTALAGLACGGSSPSPGTADSGGADAVETDDAATRGSDGATSDVTSSSGNDASAQAPPPYMTCIPLSCFGLNCECGACPVTFCGAGTLDCGRCEAGAECVANRCVGPSSADAGGP